MAEIIELPHNTEAECSVLGCCLLSTSAPAIVVSSLSEDSFVDSKNKAIFKAISSIVVRGADLDVSSLHNELINLKLTEETGGLDYLLTLTDSVMNVDSLDHYISIVKEQQTLRKLLLTANEIKRTYASGGISDIGDYIANITAKITEISNERKVGDFKTSKQVAEQVQYELKRMEEQGHKNLIGVDTGYKRLNEMTHGWNNEDLIIVAARPSMGKTALTLNLAYNAALKMNKPVAFFSLEMSATALMNRLIANRAMVPNDHIQTGWLSPSEKIKVASAVEEISNTPLYFDDTPVSLLGDIIAKATNMKNNHKDLCMIVIDYLGKIRTTKTGKVESREREVSLCTNQLKELARNLKVPVMVVCQINRDAEANDGKRPSMANLRESGSIEADADQVVLLYREDYYTSVGINVAKKKPYGQQTQQRADSINNGQPAKEEAPKDNNNVVMDIILAKNRNGKTGTTHLLFSKQYSRFDDLSDEFQEIVAQHNRTMGGDDLE